MTFLLYCLIYWLQDPPVSLSINEVREDLQRFCEELGCGYAPDTHRTWPIVFVGSTFLGGYDDFSRWAGHP